MGRLDEFFSGGREVFMTFDENKYFTVASILNEHNIKCRRYTKYLGKRFNIRAPGEREDLKTQYSIYVAKEDFEEASYLIREFYKG